MHFSQVLALASSAALVAAAPAPINVGVDDVILYGNDGRFTLMKRDDLEELKKLREGSIVPPKPTHLDDSLVKLPANEASPRKSEGSLNKRATQLVIPNPHSRFLGWDIQTSQVVKGNLHYPKEKFELTDPRCTDNDLHINGLLNCKLHFCQPGSLSHC